MQRLQHRPAGYQTGMRGGGQGLRRCVVFALLIVAGCRQRAAPAELSPGGGALAPVAGNLAIDREIALLQAGLQTTAASDPEAWNGLARALLRKARQGRDERFYAQADAAAQRALTLSTDNAGAQQVRLAVLLHAHQFDAAYRLAAAQLRQHPREPTLWGALGDAALELGDYDAALRAHQTMLDLKPDLRSYSRGAWLRYLTGDPAGAIELWGLAIEAGSSRDPEGRAYGHVQRADLLSRTGRYVEARADLDRALAELPGYAPAHAARAALILNGDGPASGLAQEALAELALALSADPQISTRLLQLEALQMAGRTAEAQAALPDLLRDGERQDPRTLSLFLSSRGEEPDLALRLAEAEATRRPDLWSQDALAWAQERSGQHEAAWHTLQSALRLGTRDPSLAYHAGVIAFHRGDRARARTELATALQLSPRWHRREAALAQALLARLPPPTP